MKTIIEIEELTCRYGAREAVSGLNLRVPEGSTYAFLGTNGAGKTTTIKTLLGLIAPEGGTASVLGTEVRRLGPRELAQIGYVSEDQKLPGALTVGELIAYARALYPTWDEGFCGELLKIFGLPTDQRVREFSRGMKVKAMLLTALAFRPKLLVLDEPFSGLDPLVRDELIQGLLGLFESESWTMFISSHDIDEVERLADWVGFIDGGRLRLSEPLEDLRARFRRVDVAVAEGAISREQLPKDAMMPEVSGGQARWIDPHCTDEEAAAQGIRLSFPPGVRFSFTPLSLRDVFVAVTRNERLNSPALV